MLRLIAKAGATVPGADYVKVMAHRRLILSCMAALSFLLFSGVTFGDEKLLIITEDFPPLNYIENDELKGPAVDIVRALKRRLSLGDNIKVYPWPRGYRFLERKKNTVLFSTTRTKIRENKFKWVGPIAEKKIGLYAKKSRNIKLETLQDAKKYLVGVQRNGVSMQYLEDRGFTNFDASTDGAANLRKLMAGHNQLWFASNSTVAGISKRLKIDIKELELVLKIESTSLYIAFNRQTDDAIITQWQERYNQLVNDGIVKTIFEKHGLESLYPTF